MNSRTRKFLSYYKPYLRWLATDLACAVIISAITLALPLCTRYITTAILEQDMPDALQRIYWMGAFMLLLVGVHTLCNLFVDYQGHMMGAMMESDMRNELFEHYMKLSFTFYDEQKTGQLMTRLTNDTFWLSELFHHGPEDLAIATLKFVGAFIILLHINVTLTLVVFIFLPIMIVYALHFNRRMNIALRQTRDRIGDINVQIEETIAGIRVVKSFINESVEKAKFAFANNRFVASRRAAYKSEAYFSAGLITFTQLITVALVIFGGIAIVHGTLDLADLVTYLLFVAVLTDPIQRYANFARLYQDGITGFHRFMDILEIEPDEEDVPHAQTLTSVQGHISFRDVTFGYEKANRNPVLNNLSLDIRAGEYVALVGPSGIGKTTLCSLIPRFYAVSTGKILLDNIDIAHIRLHSLRANIGIVHQDVYMFAGTVLENIRYGKPNASREEIIDAARQANAHDFIMALSQGYDTEIGQRGVKLSGGQKQRLSVARVFLKDPPIIIFDEATSALDNESEKAVQASLEQLARNRTTLVIAHRLTTIRNAHRVLTLTDQGLVEQQNNGALAA